MTKAEQNLILTIAKKYIYEIETRGDMKTRWNDEEDFIDTSVMSIEAALEAAYEAGKNANK